MKTRINLTNQQNNYSNVKIANIEIANWTCFDSFELNLVASIEIDIVDLRMNVLACFVTTIVDLNSLIDTNVVVVEKCKRYFVFQIDTKLNTAFVVIAKEIHWDFRNQHVHWLKKKYLYESNDVNAWKR